jgi:5-methylcytosine-specific restriction endonuclease McrA
MDAANNAARRARKKKAKGRYSVGDILALLEASNGICFYCPADISGGKHTIDHFIPLSRGGSNWPSNIRMACVNCNSMKGDMLPKEFLAYRKKLALPTRFTV